MGINVYIDRQDHSSTAMTKDRPLRAPLTDSLRSDIVLLTSYLSGQQSFLTSPAVDDHLAFSINISTLLAIGNNHGQQTQNGNAVLGNRTTMGTELVVFGENDDESVEYSFTTKDELRTTSRETNAQSRGSGSELQQNAGLDQTVEEVAEIISIVPIVENGRKLLDKWDPQIRDNRRVDLPM